MYEIKNQVKIKNLKEISINDKEGQKHENKKIKEIYI